MTKPLVARRIHGIVRTAAALPPVTVSVMITIPVAIPDPWLDIVLANVQLEILGDCN